MLRRCFKTGLFAGLGVLACAGCSSSPSARTTASSNAQLAAPPSAMPVSTTNRTPVSLRRNVTRLPPAPQAADASSGSSLEIDSGTPVAAESLHESHATDDVAASLLESATVLELRGNLEAARQQFERAVQAAPHDMKTLVSFARFADRHGQGSVAAELYQRVLEEDGANPLLWSEAGLSLCQNGRSEAGLTACRKALAANPDSARCQANLAEAITAARHFRDTDARYVETNRSETPSPAESPSTPARTISLSADPSSASSEPYPTSQRFAAGEAISSNSTPGVRDTVSEFPPTRTDVPATPFSPGSTARRFERRLPPVKTSRRTAEQPPRESIDQGPVAPPTDYGANPPPERSRFLPPGDAN